MRIRRAHNGGEPEVLVLWKGLSSFESNWEPITRLADQYPKFHLEDNVSFLRGSTDKLAVPMTLMRKKERTSGQKVRMYEKKAQRSG